MKAITIDQLRVFRQVAEKGSFSEAARGMHRAQSAVTYAVQKLEEQVDVALFDRGGYRPTLSEAGRALLPRAVRILEELEGFAAQARGIAGGLEPEVSLVAEAMYPMSRLVRILSEFQREFPSVQLRIHVESLGATAQAVLDGRADLGVALEFGAVLPDLDTEPMGEIELVPVAAPSHPLAKIAGRIPLDALRDQVQLVLADRSRLTEGRDYSVFAVRTWRLADLGARHEMLLAGLGWGSMPRHMIEEDLKAGRLKRLDIRGPGARAHLPRPAIVLVRRKGKVLGPAGRWLAQRLVARDAAAVARDRRSRSSR